jgi:hypothetical protein
MQSYGFKVECTSVCCILHACVLCMLLCGRFCVMRRLSFCCLQQLLACLLACFACHFSLTTSYMSGQPQLHDLPFALKQRQGLAWPSHLVSKPARQEARWQQAAVARLALLASGESVTGDESTSAIKSEEKVRREVVATGPGGGVNGDWSGEAQERWSERAASAADSWKKGERNDSHVAAIDPGGGAVRW